MKSISESEITPVRRLAGIDGLRGFAALWVVFFHMAAFSLVDVPIPGINGILRSGSTGVSLFLVLSGFCLYLPFAGGRTHRFNTTTFFTKRARRLLPAYYASILLAVGFGWFAAQQLGLEGFSLWQLESQVITHLTLTHNLFPSTFFALNGAYWSLALEWQLYLGMPFLVAGIRRFGVRKVAFAVTAGTIAYRLALGAAIDSGTFAHHKVLAGVVLPNQIFGRWAEFVFGVVAAELYVTNRIEYWIGRLKFGMLVLIPFSLFIGLSPASPSTWLEMLRHIMYGAVYFLLLSMVLSSNNYVSRVFSWTPLVWLGTISYSLYLTHDPVLKVIQSLLGSGASPMQMFIVFFAALPLILLVAWALFMTVERHTLTTHGGGKLSVSKLVPLPIFVVRWSRALRTAKTRP